MMSDFAILKTALLSLNHQEVDSLKKTNLTYLYNHELD